MMCGAQLVAGSCIKGRAVLALMPRELAHNPWETRMTWKTPKIVEIAVGMEINMYACAARK